MGPKWGWFTCIALILAVMSGMQYWHTTYLYKKKYNVNPPKYYTWWLKKRLVYAWLILMALHSSLYWGWLT